MNFDIFDNFLDSVFVIDKDRQIVYCNEAATVLTEISMRRLSKKKIFDVFTFEKEDLFVMPNGTLGKEKTHPFTELRFYINQKEKEGKVQMSISPIQESEGVWLVVLHDVTLEEQLHVKYLVELNIKEKVIEDLKSAQKALEAYSKNLEQMVKDRTKELSDANLLLNAIMDSLGQGFLVFNEGGVAGDIYTKACLDILEVDPSGMPVVEILKLEGEEKAQFGQWITTAIEEMLPFDSMVELGPRTYKHSKGKHIILDFYPIRNNENKIVNIVMVATDNTKEYIAELSAQKERSYSNMIVRLVKNKNQFSNFIRTAQERLEVLLSYAKHKDRFDLGEVMRVLHTLEGEAGAFGATEIANQTKECQSHLEPYKLDQTLEFDFYYNDYKIEIAKLSKYFQDFLVENDELFMRLGVYGDRKVEVTEVSLKNFYKNMKKEKVNENILKGYKNAFLTEPFAKFVSHYDEIIKTIAEKQGKNVLPLVVKNGSMKISGDRYKPLMSSLVHAFRNSMDHAIEFPQERSQAGKRPQGRIEIEGNIKNENGKSCLEITIKDDGRGIDAEAIRSRIKDKCPEDIDKLSDHDVYQFIFDAGLSSRDEVTEFSGRGVGMDAIKTEVERLNGTVIADSTPGKGTVIVINIPESEEDFDIKLSA